jgi:peptidoglycan-N-acetylglucosamine deacetylase
LTRGLLFAAALIVGSAAAYGSEPEFVARSDGSPWPEPIASAAAFDRASRAEILVVAAALRDAAKLDAAALMRQFHIEQADTASVRKVAARLAGVLLDNYRIASAACAAGEVFCEPIADRVALSAAGRAIAAELPEKYRAWYGDARQFATTYAAELVRLAALFPTISSEIDLFSPVEHDGFELPDRHFQLTFDDGPAARGGQTDALLKVLHEKGLHAFFFLLGEELEARLRQDDAPALRQLYAGQCASLHGWKHLSHATWAEWQSSVLRTRALVQATFPEQYRPRFRPPYGERLPDSGAFFNANGLTVALWNINSQDWNDFMTTDDVARRVATLMLLWRRGVILMHDIHPKAALAVPRLLDRYRDAGVVWEDCR